MIEGEERSLTVSFKSAVKFSIATDGEERVLTISFHRSTVVFYVMDMEVGQYCVKDVPIK